MTLHQAPGGPGSSRSERLRNKGNVLQIANRNGVSLAQLLDLNPDLQKYAGTRKLIPAGTTVFLPAG